MTEIINIIVVALATFAVSALISTYDGPGHIFLHLRSRFPDSPMHCTVCMSIWIAIPFSIVFILGWTYGLMPLAIVGAVILLERL